jgi:hypothetical protein
MIDFFSQQCSIIYLKSGRDLEVTLVYKGTCKNLHNMTDLTLWNSTKQYEEGVEHRCTLHSVHITLGITAQFGFLQRPLFSVNVGHCPVSSLLISWTGTGAAFGFFFFFLDLTITRKEINLENDIYRKRCSSTIYRALYSFCDYRMQFCGCELERTYQGLKEVPYL